MPNTNSPPKSGHMLSPAREFFEQRGAPLQALRGPARGNLIEFGLRRDIGRQLNPGLLRRSINMNVGRQSRGLIESSHTDESNGLPCAAVNAPNGDFADWAARDLLAFPALRWRVDEDDLAGQQLHPVCFNHGVQGKRRTRLSLAPAAMATVDEERLAHHSISNGTASAAAIQKSAGRDWFAHTS